MLSNDLDSLWSCTLLEQVKGWKINYFYDFNSIYYIQKSKSRPIGVDIDFTKGKCFSNHVTMLNADDAYNKQAINFNIADKVNISNYYNKYSGSTVLMLYWLYDIPLPKSIEGKMILLAIDGTFSGYYLPYKQCREANYHYLVEVMGYEELYYILQEHKADDFRNIAQKWKTYERIQLKDRILTTDLMLKGLSQELDIPLYLPENDFKSMGSMQNKMNELPSWEFTNAKNNKQIFSMALTRKNLVNYTKMEVVS